MKGLVGVVRACCAPTGAAAFWIWVAPGSCALGSRPNEEVDSGQIGVSRPVGDSASSWSEVTLIFLGASWCAGVNTPGLAESVRRASIDFAASATRAGVSARVIGISLDHKWATGVKFLERFGPFSEIVSGGAWLNTGSLRYLWSDLAGAPSMPQLIVTSRRIERAFGGLTIGQENLIARYVGVREIMAESTRKRMALVAGRVATDGSIGQPGGSR